MYKIRLDDGTEYPVRFCSARGDTLTASILTGQSFLTVAQTFTDNTHTVAFIYDSTEEDFAGYTELVMINGTTAGEYSIMLKKAVNN